MSSFDQSAFNSFVVESGVVGFFDKPIKLKSGRQSNWYVNWRRVAGDVFLIDNLSDFVLDFINKLVAAGEIEAPDCIYGVPEGASKLGILCQYKWAKNSKNYGPSSHVLAMGRGQPKAHGAPEDKYFVGMPQGKTLILEDVTTTGGSLLTTIDALNEARVKIIGTLGLTNRMEKRDDGLSVEDAIAKKTCAGKPIKYFAMSSALQLLPEVCKLKRPTAEIVNSIEAEFREFGVKQIALNQ